MKTVLITTEFRRIDKRRWPQFVKDFVDNPDVNSIHPEAGSKIAYHRFNTDSYPRLAFLEEKDSNGNIVYVIRKYFSDHKTYDLFCKLAENEKRQRCKYSSLDLEDIEKEFAKFIEKKEKSPLPKEMRDFEKRRDFSNTATTYVFEMEEWCKHIRNKELEDDKKDIFEAVQNIVIEKVNTNVDDSNWHTINFAGGKEIIFRVHESTSHVYYYLFEIGGMIDKNTLKNKYIDLSDERLLKQARKGYPDWILYGDFEDWKRLENDDEANLALSDEEIQVLNKTPYPYFVNGLAGSGKSTILYYLFAHAYSSKEIRPMDLLFLSYSPKLISKAKSVIKALLRTNPSYHGFKLADEEEKNVDLCFWPFQDFLISTIISTAEEINQFASSKHLSYEHFQKDYQLTCKLNEAKNYSAAIVWSVIRTFIKGRDYNTTFSINSYNTLHKSDKTVNSSDYENIYKIWKNWYKPTYEGKMWDDLDLVIYVLKKMDSGFEYKRYDIIYCDEAQDFTPIENILILKLSKYTEFDLKGYQNIPIAYAGDPNQTVSPTGFNWKRLKEIVDNTFSELAGDHIRLEEKTLNNNYRSKRTIVEFANSIQYIRKKFLSDDNLTPQEQWNPQANPLPGFFFLTKDGSQQDDSLTIKAGFAKTECIITGAEGEYERELDKDELTAESTILDDKLLASVDNKTKLYTAISSKGLEFKAVLLYRFADQLPNSFKKLLNKEDFLNESERYELSHFFTKLYIAVSRAKEVLYIADSQENYEKFWKYFIDNVFVKELLTGKQEYSIWENKIGGIEIGNRAEYLSRMAENFSPLETARKIYEDAKLSANAKDMNRAAGYFEEAGDFAMAEESKAYVLFFEKEYLSSGQKFLRLGHIEEATKAFWKGCCWEELSKNSDRAIFKIVSLFMTGKLSLIEFIKKENIADNFSFIDETWKQTAIRIGNEAKNVDASMVYTVCEFLESLVGRGFIYLNPIIADLYFKNKQYLKAIAKWDELATLTHNNRYCESKSYFAAKEETSITTSDRLYWMNRGGKNDEILDKYSTPNDAEVFMLDERARRIVFSLLLKSATFSQALEYPIHSGDKLSMLYKADRIQFIEHYVLTDFGEEKFTTWIEQPIKNNDSDFFDNDIPLSLFKKIFSLPTMSDWILFMKLKDNGGYHVMKNAVNVNHIADAVCWALEKKYYVSLASCFLDIVFNNPHYNYANANKYCDTLISIFSMNDLSTRDFIAVTKRNKYFVEAELAGYELDIIKDRLRGFVSTKLSSYKNFKKVDYRTLVTLCKIYEKVAPQIQDNRGKYVYDYENVLSFYSSLIEKKSLPEDLLKYIDIRRAVIMSHYKGRQGISTFEKALPKMVSIEDVVSTCDKEDLIWLIGFVYGKYKVEQATIEKWGLTLSKSIYDFDILLHDYDRKETRNNLKNNFINYADSEIGTILSGDKINDYSLKLCAYLYEVFLDGNLEKASKYDTLAKSPRLVKLNRLVNYLQQRALHFYSYGSENKFKMVSIDYDISLSMAAAREKIRPLIEEKNVEKISNGKINGNKKATSNDSSSKTTSNIIKEKRSSKEKTTQDPLDLVKMAQLEMARNLKKMGVPIETIRQAAPQLTIEEIVKL